MSEAEGRDTETITQDVDHGLQNLRFGKYAQVVAQLEAALGSASAPTEAARLLRVVFEMIVAGEGEAQREALMDAVLGKRAVARELIVLALENQRLAEALAWCSRLLQRDPDDVGTLWLQSLAYEGGGQYASAVAVYDRLVELEPNKARAYYRRGAAFLAVGDEQRGRGLEDEASAAYQKAIRDYSAALEREPELVEAYYERALLYQAQGNHEQALQDYDAVVRRAPENPVVYYNRAGAHFVLGHDEAALADYSQAIQLAPEFVDAFVGRGRVYAAQEKPEQALQEYNAALRLDPESTSAHGFRGDLHRMLGDQSSSEGSRNKATEGYQQALADYDAVLRSAPDIAYAYLSRGRVRARLDEAGQALADYSAALEREPELVEAYYERALLYQAQGNHEQALQDYDAVVRRAPENPVVYYNRAGAHFVLGHDEAALADYSQAIQLAPEFVDAFVGRGRVYAAQEKPEQALQEYNAALRLDPKAVEAYYERGQFYEAQRNYEQALKDYDSVVDYASGSPVIYRNRAGVHFVLGHDEAALADYGRAIVLAPEFVDAYVGRGQVYAAQEQYEQALQEYNRALEFDGNNPLAYRGRASVYLGLGDAAADLQQYGSQLEAYQKAIEDSKRALEQAPDDVWAYRSWGLALRAIKNYDEAVQVIDQALAKPDAKDPEVAALLHGEKGETLRLWGQSLKHRVRLQEAVATFDQALEGAPTSTSLAWIYDAKGAALIDLEQYAASLPAFDQALRCDSNHHWARIGHGKARYFLGEFRQAQEAFEQVVSTDLPSSQIAIVQWAQIGMGLVLEQTGARARALAAYAEALPKPDGADAYMVRADVFEYFGAYQKAEADHLKALELRPNSAEVHNSLAWLYLDRLPVSHHLDKALYHSNRAVEIEGDGSSSGHYLDTLGWAYYELARYREAIGYLRKAVALLPHDLEIRVHVQEAERKLQDVGSNG